jgi:hypothetical protein
MATIKSYSIADGEEEVFEAFKAICKQKKQSVSWSIMDYMAKAVQAHKEGKEIRYHVR